MKKIFYILGLFLFTLAFSGCSLPGTGGSSGGVASLFISNDGGTTWRAVENEEQRIFSASILSIETDPSNPDLVYAGMKGEGILKSEDKGVSWNYLNFQSIKVYGLAVDPANTQVIYASGVWQGRGKIFKSLDRGENWKEIYTMPADGPLIISMAIGRNNTDILYAGSSEGQLVKTEDGGDTWENIFKDSDPIIGLALDKFNDNLVYLATTGTSSFRSSDGGKTFSEMSDSIEESIDRGRNFEIVKTDPNNGSWVYLAGEDGLILSRDGGENWEEINVLSNTENFPVHAFDINPWNSKEIIYGSARALYKSVNGGETWTTHQFETSNLIKEIEYDSFDPSTIFIGFVEK